MISDAYNGTLVETDEGYIYTLSVPNKKKDKEIELLTVTKKVTGSFGNKSKEFSFELVVSGAEEDEAVFILVLVAVGKIPVPRVQLLIDGYVVVDVGSVIVSDGEEKPNGYQCYPINALLQAYVSCQAEVQHGGAYRYKKYIREQCHSSMVLL